MSVIFRYVALFLVLVIISIRLVVVVFNGEKIKYLTHEVTSFEVVIARYNEDLSWIAELLPNEKITVYNKGKDNLNLPSSYKIVKLPNIGRESHTYLYHIVNNYNQLADRVLFLQGDPFSEKRFIFLPLKQYKIIAKTNCKAIIAAGCFLFNSKKENNYLKSLVGTKWNNTIYKEYDFIKYKNEFITPNARSSNSFFFFSNYGANFAVDKERILAHNINDYNKILASLDNIAPIEGHYMERLWDILFANERD